MLLEIKRINSKLQNELFNFLKGHTFQNALFLKINLKNELF